MAKTTVIIGCGESGSTTASILSQNNSSVYIVDRDARSFENLDDDFSGIMIEKDIDDIQNIKYLIDEPIDILLVVTGNDTTNIFLSTIAKQLLNIETVITRLYDETREILFEGTDIDVFYPSLLALGKIEYYAKIGG